MRSPCRRNVRALGVGRKVKYVSVAAGAKQYGMSGMRFYFSGNKVAGYYAFSGAVYHNQIKHFSARVHSYITQTYLPG